MVKLIRSGSREMSMEHQLRCCDYDTRTRLCCLVARGTSKATDTMRTGGHRRRSEEGQKSGEDVEVMICIQEETKLERYLADVACQQ